MEVAYDLTPFFESLSTGPVARLDRAALLRLSPKRCWAVKDAIDHMGAGSTAAQGLKRQLTTYDKVLDTEDEQAIYLMWEKHPEKENASIITGLLKVGRKKLFLMDEQQRQYETTPLCVLDFYVHETRQRQGFGHVIFDAMLVEEAAEPYTLAFDRPSTSLLSFLAKHYQLEKEVWQNTHFVVYPLFFEDYKPIQRDQRRTVNYQAISEKQQTRVGSRSSSRGTSPRHSISSARDSAAGIIHGTAPLPARPLYGADTPQGRKNTRDFGHTNLW